MSDTLPNVKIIYRNVLEDEINFDRFGPIFLTNYSGFGSPENEVSSQKLFGVPGQRKTSSSRTYRDMTIGVAIKESSFEELKSQEHKIMAVINPELAGTILININDNLYSIDVEVLKGYESNSATGASSSSATLQFRALDPDWRDENQSNKAIVLTGTKKKMKFPLAITSGFAFATIKPGEIVTVENKGDFAVGFEMKLKINAPVVNPRIYNVLTQEYFGWNMSLNAGDEIYLSTVRLKKRTWLTDDVNPEPTNIMGKRIPGSSFFVLDNLSANNLVIQADTGIDNILGTLLFTQLIIGV